MQGQGILLQVEGPEFSKLGLVSPLNGFFLDFVLGVLMVQRLARRAEDQEVPGSSPTQD